MKQTKITFQIPRMRIGYQTLDVTVMILEKTKEGR